ncbi:MAG: hypothetical protein ABSB78_14125 [Bacteroidota bacterium]
MNINVFILGAGASNDYGFPTARELIFDIYESPILLKSQNTNPKLYSGLNISAEEFEEFRLRLHQSPSQSVDIFLENNEKYENVGKCAIASQLIACELKDSLMFRTKTNYRWYEYLFNKIGTTLNEFKDNYQNFAFITFNYDRSLEYYLYYQLNMAYNIPLPTSAAMIRSMKIIHVYGSLGEPKFLSENGRDYLPEISIETIRNATENIQILKSNTKETDKFQEAHLVIGSAKRLVFLGFSFGRENVRRLMPIFDSEYHYPFTIGTGYGMEQAEVINAKSLFDSKFNIIITNYKILELLRNEPLFD